MANKNEILTQLAQIRETGEYTQADIEFIEMHMDNEEDAIRAAAILSTDGCLYDLKIVDKIFEMAHTDPSVPVRKAAIQQLGRFITACVLEGFEDEGIQGKGLEFEDDFKDLLEKGIEEKYQEVKSFLLEKIVTEDPMDEFYPDFLVALAELSGNEVVRQKIEEAWMEGDEGYRKRLFPAIARHPEFFESLILDALESVTDEQFTIQILESASLVKSPQMAKMVETFLHSVNPEIVSQALITLAEINQTEGLNEILQKYCLHDQEDIQLAAKKALDIFSRNNFEDFMKQYFE